jgi:D-alanyl-D-alanine-carboxypeptidase/D-alanyl-D-alanine-endopeptidase
MRSILFFFILAIAAFPARAVETPNSDPLLAEATDLAGTAMFIDSGAPGMVLVIVRGGHSLVLGYGETEKGRFR